MGAGCTGGGEGGVCTGGPQLRHALREHVSRAGVPRRPWRALARPLPWGGGGGTLHDGGRGRLAAHPPFHCIPASGCMYVFAC